MLNDEQLNPPHTMNCFFLNHNLALNLNLFGDGGIKIKSRSLFQNPTPAEGSRPTSTGFGPKSCRPRALTRCLRRVLKEALKIKIKNQPDNFRISPPLLS